MVNIKDKAHLELLATRVAEAGHGAQMFEAVKALQGKQRTRVEVHNKDGEAILLPDLAAAAIATHFESQFPAPGVTPLPMFTGPPRALNRPITCEEVSAVVKKMKPRKATGPDECPIELIKAGGVATHAFIASVINGSYRHHQSLDIGAGILAACQKPGKPPGPVQNLRPIVLLTSVRKILSLIFLNRIRSKVDQFLSPSQAGFRSERSTADIV